MAPSPAVMIILAFRVFAKIKAVLHQVAARMVEGLAGHRLPITGGVYVMI